MKKRGTDHEVYVYGKSDESPYMKKILKKAKKFHYKTTFKFMTKRELAAAAKAQQKAQKDAEHAAFKREARFKALETAERLNPNPRVFLDSKRKRVAFDVTKESEKIYQWLIKVLK